MVNGSSVPIIVGMAIGIAFVVLFSVILKPDFMLSDEELVEKYSKLAEVSYFLEKYPEAKAEVSRSPNENYLEMSYTVERQVKPPSELYRGVNTFGVHVYTRPNHLSLGLSCGVHQGVTIGWGFDDINSIDKAEKDCFHIADNKGVFEPDPPVFGDRPRYPVQ